MRTMLALTAALVAVTGTAAAQYTTDEQLNGIVRGIEAQNSSAQVGEVLVHPRTRDMMVTMHGTSGKPETVTITRGSRCSDEAAPPVATLGTLSRDGTLRATVPIPLERVLSGNYNVVVRNTGPDSRPVGCGHLYLH